MNGWGFALLIVAVSVPVALVVAAVLDDRDERESARLHEGAAMRDAERTDDAA